MDLAATGRTTLGRTGIEVSALGLGTWAWGDRLVWGYPGRRADAALEEAFRAARDLGIDLFDTAEFYGFGTSERLLGRFARADGRPVAVATKFFPSPWRLTRASLPAALRGSLRRLGLPRVTLYQIHFPLPLLGTTRWIDGLAEAVETGLCAAAGVSNYNAAQLRAAHARLAARGIPLATNQIEYSLLHRDPERNGVLDACRELGITPIAYSPLAQGALTGKYGPDRPLPAWRGRQIGRRQLARVGPLIERLQEIGAARGRTPAQVALNWILKQGALPIPGARDARQAGQNAGALGWSLSAEEAAALTAASDWTRPGDKR